MDSSSEKQNDEKLQMTTSQLEQQKTDQQGENELCCITFHLDIYSCHFSLFIIFGPDRQRVCAKNFDGFEEHRNPIQPDAINPLHHVSESQQHQQQQKENSSPLSNLIDSLLSTG